MARKWYEKLTAENVAEIAERCRGQGEARSQVGRDFQISPAAIGKILAELPDNSVGAAAELIASKTRRYKAWVIEKIFDARWDATARTLQNSLVTLREISAGIRDYNAAHPAAGDGRAPSDRNVANFFKDFARNIDGANAAWPHSIFERGYTGWQLTGDGRCFEFIAIPPAQAQPFVRIEPPGIGSAREIGTLTIPLASQRLGRADESWLTQVLVRLGLVESHFAIASPRRMLEIVHLQMNVKQAGAEIDSMYRALEKVGEVEREAIIVCEAKGRRDDILVSQLVAQVQTAFNMPTLRDGYDEITAIAIKVIGDSQIQIVEFAPLARDAIEGLRELQIASNTRYALKPAVIGIC